MAIHDGIYNQAQYENFDRPTVAPSVIDYDLIQSDYAILADHTYEDPSLIPTIHEGLIDHSATPFSQVLERVYFFPVDDNLEHRYDFGIISSDITVSFWIWNAFQIAKNTTAISSLNPTGTSLDVPSLPFYISANLKNEYFATILEAGPPEQDTTYFFTIGGVLFEFYLTAERLIELDRIFMPNWARPTSFSFEFETVISQTKTSKEQRKPLHEVSKRVQGASFTVWERDFENAHNILKTAHEKVFFIPVYHEVLLPTNATLNGEMVIDFEEELSGYWNLRNRTSFLQVLSIHDNTLVEVVSIDSIDLGLNQITLVSPISKDFITKKTIIMPIMKAIITDFKPVYINDKISEFELNFEELRGL